MRFVHNEINLEILIGYHHGTLNAVLSDMYRHRRPQDRLEGGDENIERVTIKGLVIPVDWDEKGTVVAVAISTHDEKEYLIDRDQKGQELLHFIQQEVQASGVLREREDKKKIIAVQRYTLFAQKKRIYYSEKRRSKDEKR